MVEVLIAIIILAGGLIALVNFQADLFRGHSDTSQHSQALQLAQNKLSDLRRYTVLDTTSGQFAYQDIANGNDSQVIGNTSFTRAWTVTESTSPPYKTVAVTVSWTNRQNEAKSVTLDSIIGKVDPAISGEVTQDIGN